MKGVEIKCSCVKHTLALLVTVVCERKSTINTIHTMTFHSQTLDQHNTRGEKYLHTNFMSHKKHNTHTGANFALVLVQEAFMLLEYTH